MDKHAVDHSHVAPQKRETALAALCAQQARGSLITRMVESAATELGVTARTVWRWMAKAKADGNAGRKNRPRFEVTADHMKTWRIGEGTWLRCTGHAMNYRVSPH